MLANQRIHSLSFSALCVGLLVRYFKNASYAVRTASSTTSTAMLLPVAHVFPKLGSVVELVSPWADFEYYVSEQGNHTNDVKPLARRFFDPIPIDIGLVAKEVRAL